MSPANQYRDKRGGVIAHREIEVLSHAFTKAVEWGLIDRHPFKGQVRLTGEKHRDRYIEDWEVLECLALPIVRKRGSVLAIQTYIRLKFAHGSVSRRSAAPGTCPAVQGRRHPRHAPQDREADNLRMER